jgi:hypothetical protein
MTHEILVRCQPSVRNGLYAIVFPLQLSDSPFGPDSMDSRGRRFDSYQGVYEQLTTKPPSFAFGPLELEVAIKLSPSSSSISKTCSSLLG